MAPTYSLTLFNSQKVFDDFQVLFIKIFIDVWTILNKCWNKNTFFVVKTHFHFWKKNKAVEHSLFFLICILIA